MREVRYGKCRSHRPYLILHPLGWGDSSGCGCSFGTISMCYPTEVLRKKERYVKIERIHGKATNDGCEGY
jgi:uncharacterized protein (DUF779 family)